MRSRCTAQSAPSSRSAMIAAKASSLPMTSWRQRVCSADVLSAPASASSFATRRRSSESRGSNSALPMSPLSIAVNEPANAAAELGQLAINRLKLDPARAGSRRLQPSLVFVENAGGVLEQGTALLTHRRVQRRDGHDPSIAPALTMEPMALGPRAAIVVIPAARIARIARLPAPTEGVATFAADQQSLQQVAHAGAALPVAAPVLGQLLLGALKQLSFDHGWYGNPDPVLARRWDLAKWAFGHSGPTARRAQRWAPRDRGVFPKDGLPGISGVRQQRPEHAAAPVGVPGRARHAGLKQPPRDR